MSQNKIYVKKEKCFLYNSIGAYTSIKIKIRENGVINILNDNVKENMR